MKTGWFGYLKNRRGRTIPAQMLHMLRLHRTPFGDLLSNIYEALDASGASYTFPLVASTARRDPDLVRSIARERQEIACHGYRHVSYRFLPETAQEQDIRRGTSYLRNAMGLEIRGFRAPYNNYTDATPRLIEVNGFLWDIGIGYQLEYRDLRKPFRVDVDGRESEFICIPLSGLSDDVMIDTRGLNASQMAAMLRESLEAAAGTGGVIMYDLHPIRMGQPEYVPVLEEMLSYGSSLGAWFPTVSEAVERWRKYGGWRGDAKFCCLLTGDIDNFTFTDYLLRMRGS